MPSDEMRERLEQMKRDPGPLGSAVCLLSQAMAGDIEFAMLTTEECAKVLAALLSEREAREPGQIRNIQWFERALSEEEVALYVAFNAGAGWGLRAHAHLAHSGPAPPPLREAFTEWLSRFGSPPSRQPEPEPSDDYRACPHCGIYSVGMAVHHPFCGGQYEDNPWWTAGPSPSAGDDTNG